MISSRRVLGAITAVFAAGVIYGVATRPDTPISERAESLPHTSKIGWLYIRPKDRHVRVADYNGKPITELVIVNVTAGASQGIDALVQRANPCAKPLDVQRLGAITRNIVEVVEDPKARDLRNKYKVKTIVVAFNPEKQAQNLTFGKPYPVASDPSLQYCNN